MILRTLPLQGYYDALRVEEARNGMKITVLSPGMVKTNLFARCVGEEGARINTVSSKLNFFQALYFLTDSRKHGDCCS